MIFEQKICYMFNKFFSSFIKDLKTMDDTLKASIKKNYKVIDKSSEEYFEFFWQNVKGSLNEFVESDAPWESDVVKSMEVVKGITIGNVLDVLKDENTEVFWNYINILLIFAYLYNETKTSTSENDSSSQGHPDGEEEPKDTNDTDNTDNTENASTVYPLFVKFVRILSMIQKGDDPKVELDDIIDDDVKRLASRIKHFTPSNDDAKVDETADVLPNPPMEFLESIENSQIANLAKEISKEIDISSLNIEKPEDIAKLMDFSGSNNFLGDIVSKVSTKLNEKIANGSMKQEDLMSEAMGMMSMLNGGGGGGIADMLKNMGGLGGMLNNPMFAEMMKQSKKGKTQTRNTNGQRRGSASTRDRLRKKLDEKKKQEQKET